MSSMGLGGGLSGGLRGGLSRRSLRSFAFTDERDPLEGLEEWQLLQRAGASEAEVERARLEAATVGPRGVQQLGAAIGIPPEEDKKGILASFFDVMVRPQSAVTGFLTGLAGLERQRVTAKEGEFLPDRNRTVEGGLGLAFQRFADGLSGREQYRAADFGVLAYDREDASLGERFVKSGAGFILDVALDPITYMSMGGSIFGRVRGAQRVWGAAKTKNRADVLSLVDDAPEQRIFDIIRTTPEKYGGATTSKIAANLRELGVEGITEKSTMDDILAALAQNPALQKEFAADMIAANMGMAYRGGSSAGLRGYLLDSFGDAGLDMFRKLPPDIQGGIRMRVPFSSLGGKDPKVLFRIPGTEGLSSLTNGTRDFLRNHFIGVRGLVKETGGRMGLADKRLASAYYRSVHESARKVWGEWVPHEQITRADGTKGTVFTIGWLDVQDTQKIVREVDDDVAYFTNQLKEIFDGATVHISAGRKLAKNDNEFNEQFYRVLDDHVYGTLSPDGQIQASKSVIEVFGPNPTPLQIEAFNAAVKMQIINKKVLDKGRMVWDGDPKFGGKNMLEALGQDGEYWPRIVEQMNTMLKGAKTRTGGRKPGFLFDRDRFFSFLKQDGSVESWMSPLEVMKTYGEEIFAVDPERVMMAYMTAVTRSMRDEMLTRSLVNGGIALRGTPVYDWNTDAFRREALGVIRNMRVMQAGARGIDTVANEIDADRVYAVLRGWKRGGRRIYDAYDKVNEFYELGDDVVAAVRSIDGTTIETIGGAAPSYRVSREGKYLSATGEWVDNVANAQAFSRSSDAQLTANTVMRESRVRDYQDRAQELLDEFKSRVADDLAVVGEGGPLDPMRNPWLPENMPIGREQQEDYILSIVEVIKDYSDLKPNTFRSRPIRGAQYKELTEGRGLGLLGDRTAEENVVRGSLAARWNDLGLLTPAALVDEVQRLTSIRSQGGKLSKFIDEFYMPFYAMQKSLMTSQRGPGYVIRNIAGGVWNAYLFGVGAKHWKGSSVALIARNKAWAAAQKEFPDAPISQADFAIKEFERLLKESLGDKAGAEMFKRYQTFDRLQLGGRSIRSRELGTRAAELDRDIPEDIRRAIAGGDTTKYLNAVDYIATRNRWAQFMTRNATESEDFLRFASFLRGVDDYGLGDGGHLAGMYVRASQFDYTDLSRFEREQLKLIMPFYTWMRNNVPLQFRALISEPGKVLKALRVNEALRDAFGEPGDEGEPLPIWVRENMGWRIRKDFISGPAGDALTMGVLIGEPLVDVNRMFRTGGDGIHNVVNWREAINSMNPAFDVISSGLRGIELSTGGTLPPTEPAPPWAGWLGLGTVTPDGERVMSARLLRTLRTTLAPFGQAERLAPQFFGNERYQRRVLSSWASTLFGVPVSTLDPFQTGAELRTQQRRMQNQLREQLGENWDIYTGFVRMLVDNGATASDMQIIRESVLGLGPNQNIASLPVERIDYTAARQTLQFLRRMETLQELGVPEETMRMLWNSFEPQTDAERGVYAGKPQPIAPEVLAEYGLTPNDVERMSREQLIELIQRVAGG